MQRALQRLSIPEMSTCIRLLAFCRRYFVVEQNKSENKKFEEGRVHSLCAGVVLEWSPDGNNVISGVSGVEKSEND